MRTLAEQRRLFSEGLSKTMNSKHLPQPGGFAWAVDLSPLPIDWDYANGFYYFAGMLQGVARESVPPGWKIRWGGNWDMDFELTDNKFMDLVHFELVKL
jgi:peptidoglycan L-alanyl-D-glutamate endopeptidase CwlK